MILLTVWLIIPLRQGVQARLVLLRTGHGAWPVHDVVYLTAAAYAVVPFDAPWPYDRYLLPLWPACILLLLRHLGPLSRRLWRALLAGLVLFGGFSLLAQADFVDRAAAHWAAANQVLARGVPWYEINAGFEWTIIHSYDDQGRPTPAPADLAMPPYRIDDGPYPGYHAVGQVPYFSRLGGFSKRTVWLLARDLPVTLP